MARIRSVKPEFWTSAQVVECSLSARLLFVGMWNFCDDNGIHPDSVKRLKMEVFPADALDDKAILAMVDELVSVKLVERYEVDGERYLRVTGWAKHQKIDRPTCKYPTPPLSGKIDDGPPTDRRDLGDNSSSAHPPEWNGEDRNRRKKYPHTP